MSQKPVTKEQIEWAKAYPFDVPTASYVYFSGRAHEIDQYSHEMSEWTVRAQGRQGGLAEALTDAQRIELEKPRLAVLACGSNASPTRLQQKYAAILPDSVIPVLRCTLNGHAIVHAANLTAYGSVPATFARAPGASVRTFATLLTADQLAIMDETETLGIAYDRLPIAPDHVQLECQTCSFEAFEAYVSLHGALLFEGEPRSLATIDGEKVPYAPTTQVEALSHVHSMMEHGGSLDDFIHENLADKPLRIERARRLKHEFSQPWATT